MIWYVSSGGRFHGEGDAVVLSFTVFAVFLLGAIPAAIGFLLAVAGYLKAADDENVCLRRVALGVSAAYVVPVLLLFAGQ
jgi:hypothetical protein